MRCHPPSLAQQLFLRDEIPEHLGHPHFINTYKFNGTTRGLRSIYPDFFRKRSIQTILIVLVLKVIGVFVALLILSLA
uniref:Uncharacterized protein n=1 Tax=Lepeophtheirus salmonis TaxID=72036 RepID=A0A0K2SV08_LEPSM